MWDVSRGVRSPACSDDGLERPDEFRPFHGEFVAVRDGERTEPGGASRCQVNQDLAPVVRTLFTPNQSRRFQAAH